MPEVRSLATQEAVSHAMAIWRKGQQTGEPGVTLSTFAAQG